MTRPNAPEQTPEQTADLIARLSRLRARVQLEGRAADARRLDKAIRDAKRGDSKCK
jgi:hypothetical protein